MKKSDVFRGLCVNFGADPNTNVDLMNLNKVSSGDCRALVEV